MEEVKVNDETKEEAPAAALEAEKQEAAAAPGGNENKEEAASNEPPPPPPPVILGIDLHCTGCSNKISGCILRCKGNYHFRFPTHHFSLSVLRFKIDRNHY